MSFSNIKEWVKYTVSKWAAQTHLKKNTHIFMRSQRKRMEKREEERERDGQREKNREQRTCDRREPEGK